MIATVAILGRPNVGKSTLFNRLVGKRLAIVEPEPGVTRDWKEGEAQLAGVRFRLLDTPGLEDAKAGTIEASMRVQAERALALADVALLVFDGREGITPLDSHFANWLRTTGKPVIIVANKSEGREGLARAMEGFSLGLGEPVAISAEHGEGMAPLYEALAPYIEPGGLDDKTAITGDFDGTGSDRTRTGGYPRCHSGGLEPRRPSRASRRYRGPAPPLAGDRAH
jgi:GTP-binding protein